MSDAPRRIVETLREGMRVGLRRMLSWRGIVHGIRRTLLVIAHGDPEPVLFICIQPFLAFFIVLTQAGNTFDLPAYASIRTVVSEGMAAVISFAMVIFGVLSVASPHRWLRRVVSAVYFMAYFFVATTFVLTTPLSTGSTYYVFSLASAWILYRNVVDNE